MDVHEDERFANLNEIGELSHKKNGRDQQTMHLSASIFFYQNWH